MRLSGGDIVNTVSRVALCTCLGGPALACAEPYTCVSFDYPPLVQKEGDHPVGLAVDVVERVFKRIGHSVKVELYPWARSLEMAKTGQADCIFTIFQSAERAAFLDYSNQSLIPQIVYFYARKDTKVTFNGDMASIREYRIGTAHKIHYGPRFEDARAQLTLDEAPTIEMNFIKLAVGRVDLVPSNWYTASSTLAQPLLRRFADRIVRLPTPVESVPTYVAFSKAKGLSGLRDQFDAELRKLVASPQYAELLARYKLNCPAPAIDAVVQLNIQH
jgi:polar amino acid transport system substrate-binding protein